MELAAGRTGRSGRHFERALTLSPRNRDAQAGLIASRKFELSQGRAVPGISDTELDPRYAALIAGWRHAAARNWDALAALDTDLARIEPGEALFDVVSRLRIAGRLAAGDPEAAAEAQALAETLLVRIWSPYDALLRARAATQANRPLAAWGSLYRVADLATPNPRGRALAERALEIARELPGDQFAELRERLARLARTGPVGSPTLTRSPAPRGMPR